MGSIEDWDTPIGFDEWRHILVKIKFIEFIWGDYLLRGHDSEKCIENQSLMGVTVCQFAFGNVN